MEHEQQCATVKWFRLQYPRIGLQLFAIPNGSVLAYCSADKREDHMRYLYREGFLNGIPDMFLAYASRGFHGLFIEMKDVGKTACSVTKEQREKLEILASAGYCCKVCFGFDQARDVLLWYVNQSPQQYGILDGEVMRKEACP